jgi:hypothetical protein
MRAVREGSVSSMRAAGEGSMPSTRAARGSQPSVRAARPAQLFEALAVDVSERGMKLEVAGVSLKALLDSSDLLVRLEVTLAHPQLAHVGPLTGHVQWRGPGTDRNSWTLGARFDAPFHAHVLSQILRFGATTAKGTSALPALGLGVVALLVAIGWYRAQTAAAVESENAARRLSSAEDDLAEVKSELERCRSRQLAPPAGPGVAHASPPDIGVQPRADMVALLRADIGALLRSDAGAPSRADASGAVTADTGAPAHGLPAVSAWTAATESRDADAEKE